MKRGDRGKAPVNCIRQNIGRYDYFFRGLAQRERKRSEGKVGIGNRRAGIAQIERMRGRKTFSIQL